MGARLLRITPRLLEQLFCRSGEHLLRIRGIPDGATVQGLFHDFSMNAFVIRIEHPSLSEVPPGEITPSLLEFVAEVRDDELEVMHASISDLKEESSAYARGLKEGAKVERGACAMLCEILGHTVVIPSDDPAEHELVEIGCDACAKAIRERGQP